MRSFLTIENIEEDFNALPPGKKQKDKFSPGFYQERTLIAMQRSLTCKDQETENLTGVNNPAASNGASILQRCKQRGI